MTISKQEFTLMQMRCQPAVKQSLTTAAVDACALGNEIKGLHEPFIQWCNLHQIVYVHSRPDKPASIKAGQPDFICLKFGAGCCVEFKALANPESGLSVEQKLWRDWAKSADVPCLVTNSLAEAIKFVTRELELKL